MFKQFAPGPYNFYLLAGTPRELGKLSEEEIADQAGWNPVAKQKEVTTKTPAEFIPHGASTDWAEKISADWKSKTDAVDSAVGASEELSEQLQLAYLKQRAELAAYLETIENEVAAYRHELWRLDQLRKKDRTNTLAYNQGRIRDKEIEMRNTPRGWQAEVTHFDDDFTERLRSLAASATPKAEAEAADTKNTDVATPEQAASLDEVLHPQTSLDYIDKIVTYTVIGIGACLMLGFATRFAAIVGIGFLLSVMATQPPWVAGADTQFFYYQMVEICALFVLATAGAGRWLGIDAALGTLWAACCGNRDDD